MAMGTRARLGAGLPVVALLSAALMVTGAVADDDDPTDELEPVDQGVADLTDLSVSLRVVNPMLREPSGFSRLYQVRGMADAYVRANGALYAVFPRSAYALSQSGQVPVVPAGTVFAIGAASLDDYLDQRGNVPDPDDASGDAGASSAAAAFPSARIDGRIRGGAPRPISDPVPDRDDRASSGGGLPRIVDDPDYRLDRLRELLRRAAAGQ